LFNLHLLSMGDNVSIHEMSYLDAAGGITIGSEVSLAHSVSILSSTHNFDIKGVSIKNQGITKKSTHVGNNVWIGAKSTVLSGINIENNVIVGSNSVVTKNLISGNIYGGNPAKLIKEIIK
jgi:acetyltransferase-like isoleucine patch superfamily enzyme